MTLEFGIVVFGQLPVGNAAFAANTFEPFVSKPPGGTTVSGVVHHKCFITMGRDTGLVTHDMDGFDTVEQTASGWPELYFLDQTEKFDPFAVKSFGWFF